MAIDGVLVAVICIEDPLRLEAVEIIAKLKKLGISKVVMMTGDSDRVASAIAKKSVWMSIIPRYCRKIKQALLRQKRMPEER